MNLFRFREFQSKVFRDLLNDIDLLTLEEIAALPGLQRDQENQFVDKKDIIEYLMLENIDINEIHDQL
jgi:hypothetical protein